MNLQFEWDEDKAWRNLLKHRVSFEEALTVFADSRAVTIFDQAHSKLEDRFKTIGVSAQTRMLLIVHSERGERIRLISAPEEPTAKNEVFMKAKTPKSSLTRGKYAAAFKKGVTLVVHTRKGDRVRKVKRNPDGSFTWGASSGQATG